MFSDLFVLLQMLLTGAGYGHTGQDLDLFTVTCENPVWGGPVTINPKGRLTATLQRRCQIVLEVSASIAALKQDIIESVPNLYIVKVGPIEEVYNSLPSIFFEVSYTSNAEGYKTSFNNDLHIASDELTQLWKVSKSKEIRGSGNSQYLKVMNDEQEVRLDASNLNTFSFQETQYVEIEQPSFAPAPIFISETKKALMQAFKKDSQDNANSVGYSLIEME